MMHKYLSKLRFKARRLFGSPLPAIIASVREAKLSYLSKGALEDLFDGVAKIEKKNIPGIIIEAGCALGGSAIVMAAAKSKSRPMFVYDVFGLIPPPSEKDGEDVHERYSVIKKGESKGIRGNGYYGYEDSLYEKVAENFHRFGVPIEENNVNLIKGLFEDTIHINESVVLAHIDGDWYQSVMTCLERIEPRLVSGGMFVIDDYRAWSGCRRAVDDYFLDKKGKYKFRMRSRLQIVRK